MSIIRDITTKETFLLTPNLTLQSQEDFSHISHPFEEDYKRAFLEGKAVGEKEGYERAHEELKELLHALNKIGNQLCEKKADLLAHLKPELIDFCIQICETVIRSELADPKSTAALIENLLAAIASDFPEEHIAIFLPEETIDAFQEEWNKPFTSEVERKVIHFKKDPLLKRGDIRIESKSTLLNHEISRLLAELREKLSR